MSKAFGLIAILIALYIGMTIYTKGMDQVMESVPGAQLADSPSTPGPRVRITDAVGARVSQDLEAGAARRGYSD